MSKSMSMSMFTVLALLVGGAAGCGAGGDGAPAEEIPEATCEIPAGTEAPDFLRTIGCTDDFLALASEPLDATIPGARAAKVVLDTLDGDALYFQNSKKYQIHYEFASKHLSGNGRPIVPSLMKFNETEYYSVTRRFILGSVTYYEGPKVWAFELAPYDTADASMIARIYDAVAGAAFFGKALYFHPTSEAIEKLAPGLPGNVRIKTTKDLFANIDYQPLNLAMAMGKLRFLNANSLDLDYVSFRDIVVLDSVPNDISVVSGIITQEFQTPLSHINVLSGNRGTPNMGLRNAHDDPRLLALKDKWVRLEVGAFAFTIAEVTEAEADAWWESHKPSAVQVPRLDETTSTLQDTATMLEMGLGLREAIKAKIPTYGGKAAHFAALSQVPGVPVPVGFAVPVFYYRQFMAENGFDQQIDDLLADRSFVDDARVRAMKLTVLREAMKAAPVNEAFVTMLEAKIAQDLPGIPVRFRSSTNAEDLDGFTGAGLYESESGHPAGSGRRSMADAVKKVWSSIWLLRAFDERAYRSIDHKTVGMALLVHRSFPAEEANGVALTANPFDPSGLEPGFYVNVQLGEASVVMPEAGAKSDQFVYHYAFQGRPVVYLEHSSLVPEGQTVLDPQQIFDLGAALDAVHKFFAPAYGPQPGEPSNKWYAMDVEFKFDGDPGQTPALYVKQARPAPSR